MVNLNEKLSESIIPKSKLIEIFVSYYGEENREKITNKINEITTQFVAVDIPKYKINMLFKQKYENNPSINWEERAEIFITNLSNLASGFGSVSPEIILQDKDILGKLGLNANKIIGKDEVGLPKIEDNNETEKLKNLMLADKAKKKINDLEFNANSFISTYNLFTRYANLNDLSLSISRDKIISLDKTLSISRSQIICLDKTSTPSLVENSPHAKINTTLSAAESKILDDILSANTPISMWTEDFAGYSLPLINKLFNKNFTTVEELKNDPSMKLFLQFQIKCSEFKSKQLKLINNTKNKTYKAIGTEPNKTKDEKFYQNSDTLGCFCAGDNTLTLPIDGKTSLHAIIHELGHGLSVWEESLEIEDKKYSIPVMGYNTAETVGGNKFDGTALNEVINEYLTEKTYDAANKEIFKDLNVRTSKQKSGYSPSVRLMQNFLDKFETKLKQYHLNNGAKDLKAFIGQGNYLKLLAITSSLASNNYGKLLMEKTTDKGAEIVDINDLLEMYEKDPQGITELYNLQESTIYSLIGIKNFINDLAEKFDEFEKGNRVDIPLNLRPIKTQEQSEQESL